MWLLLVSSCLFLIANFPLVTLTTEPFNRFHSKIHTCSNVGDSCQANNDCCSRLTCYSFQNENLCIPSDDYTKRYADDFIIPPYYNPKNYLYPYGTNMPPFPFFNAYNAKQSKSQQRNKMEWDNCRFHEDCGEGNCCYVHFRFRSLPKSFCRPNRKNRSDLCEPLTKYRSLKDVPAWKEQKQHANGEEQDEQQEQLVPLRTTYNGR